jgi:hypothetical protein
MFSIKWPVRDEGQSCEERCRNIGRTGLLVRGAVGNVVSIDKNAALLHELGLLRIVGGKVDGRILGLSRLSHDGRGGHGGSKEGRAMRNKERRADGGAWPGERCLMSVRRPCKQ